MLLASPPPGFAPDRTIFMAKGGGDVDNVADAITKVNALSPAPSAAAPAVILIYPGVYNTPPFTLPPYVTLAGVACGTSVTLEASTTTAPLCSSAGPGTISGLILKGANGVGGCGFAVAGTGGTLLDNLLVDDCETGVRVVGTGYSSDWRGVEVTNCVDGYLVDGLGARVRIESAVAEACINGLHIGSIGGIVTGGGFSARDSVTFLRHVYVEAAGAVLAIVNSVFREDKGFYNVAATISLAHASVVPGDEAYQFTAELHVGSEDRPRESCFGGGDSHTRGMAALTNTNLEVGTWNDITAGLVGSDAVSVGLFAGSATGNCFYMGGDQEFPGLKPEVTLAVGSGSLVLEYWNGSTWVEIPHVSSDANSPYGQYAQRVFQRVNVEQIRFGAITSWATKSLNGITKYWIRFRVVTAIAPIPLADRIKLHTNRTEINADGVIEYFGAAEPVRQLIWHRSLLEELDGFAQPDVSIDIASLFTIKALSNRWQNGNKDGSATFVAAQPGLDTSKGLIYEVGWAPEVTDVGNVEVQLDVVTVNPGDILDGTLPYTRQLSQIVTGPFTAYELNVTQFEFTVPNLESIGSLAINLYRDAGGGNLDDTFNANAIHVYSNLYGVFWR